MNVEFDETNGSQVGHIDYGVVGGDAPSHAIKTMGIGEFIPIEEPRAPQDEGTSSTQVESPTSISNQQATQEQEQVLQTQEQEHGQDTLNSSGDQEHHEPSTPRTSYMGDHDQEQGNDEDTCHGETIQQTMQHRVIRRASTLDRHDHFKENILGSIRRNVSTRNQLAIFVVMLLVCLV